MTARTAIQLGLVTILCGASLANADVVRRYATVIDVQPIFASESRPVTRRVCSNPEADGHLAMPVAQMPGRDVREQQAAWAAQQTCTEVTENQSRRKVSAYRVTYRYRGHTQTTWLPYHPGDRLPINVRFSTRP